METEEYEMTTEIVPQEVRMQPKLSASEIIADVQLIQEVMKAVMKEEVHFGIIPGTQKRTLYKPGAEKLMVTFRLNGEPKIEDLSTSDEIRYRVRMRITHQLTNMEIGWGVGECSSSETKYKWIRPACDAEWEETAEDRRREKWTKTKAGPLKFKQIRPNLSDAANTILKMAKKRALIDAVLTSTAASDIFDQDLEDMDPALRQNITAQNRPPMPSRATPGATPPPNPDEYDYDEPPPEKAAAGAAEEKPKQRQMIDASNGKKMAARFDAPCKLCAKTIKKESEMIWISEGPDRGAYHPACVNG